MIALNCRSRIGVLSVLLAVSLTQAVSGQPLTRLPTVPNDSEVIQASTVSDPGDLTLDEVVQRLRETEARLEAIEAGRSASEEGDAAAEPSFVNTLEMTENLANNPGSSTAPKPKKWYEKYTIRGYAQFRYNGLLQEEPGSAPAMHNGDSSVGDNQSFLIRRARLIFSGDVTDRISIYLQPDFATTPNGSTDAIYFTQIRDWYADIHFDYEKVYRVRVGQSKVPYGWENLQSSQNRLPLDRNDAFNSAVRNERDLGAFFYWTPEFAQDTFKYIMDEGLKGSGNYGVFGIGVYNGQGGSLRETNDNLHLVSRLTLPITWANGQIMEVGVQGYTGQYTVYSSRISPLGVGAAVTPLGTFDTGNRSGIVDKRVGASFIYYPQPLGFQAEWTVGRGPGLNDAQTEVIDRPLHGGYIMSMYRYQSPCHGEFLPFVRWAYYEGGYKSVNNAPYANINEWEFGLEWQISKNLEIVGMYVATDRTNTQAVSTNNTRSYEQFEGELARFQLQVSY